MCYLALLAPEVSGDSADFDQKHGTCEPPKARIMNPKRYVGLIGTHSESLTSVSAAVFVD